MVQSDVVVGTMSVLSTVMFGVGSVSFVDGTIHRFRRRRGRVEARSGRTFSELC
jgi:hypothetical protein